MLVLARSTGQSVVLDDRIIVTVLATRGTLVRLGIEAASDVAVRRGELELLDPPHPPPEASPPEPWEPAAADPAAG